MNRPRNCFIAVLLALCTASFVSVAAQPKMTRVPPPGIVIAEKDRAELRARTDTLAKQIASLRSSPLRDLLPDVEIFHKAVDWALRHDEFYRSNEVVLARNLLKQGIERATQLYGGKPEWLTATGLVVRGYVSKIDGSVQPYGLVVPASFRAGDSRPHRLDVWLHGRDNNLTELKFIADRQRSYGDFTPADAFVLHPYGRYCNAFKFAGEVDVFEAMEHVKKSYHIDERRIALRGFSMGGAGAWHLAAHHPDVWAVAAPGAGFSETADYTKALAKEPKPPAWEQNLWQLYDATGYAANFFNLPVIAYNGTEDPQRQAADMMERAMKAEGLSLPRVWGTNVAHKWTPEGKKEVSRFVDNVVANEKESFPKRVHFTTRTLRYNQAPGIQIEQLAQHWQRADLTLELTAPDSAAIQTKNVTAFSIIMDQQLNRLRTCVIDGEPVRVAVEGGLGISSVNHLRKDSRGQWKQGSDQGLALEKSPGRQGPIDDAFMESFLVVRPTGRTQNPQVAGWISSRLTRATNEWRAQFRGDARVKDDSRIAEADIAANNLVLFGDPQSNRVLRRIIDKLPIQWDGDSVRVGEKTFSADMHVPVCIFPNPLNSARYVVLNSGFTFAEAGAGSNAQQTPKLPDYAVLNIESGEAVLADFFDEHWKIK